MPCYVVVDGKKQEMYEDMSDQMVEASIHQQSKKPQSKPIQYGNPMGLLTANC